MKNKKIELELEKSKKEFKRIRNKCNLQLMEKVRQMTDQEYKKFKEEFK